MVHSPHFQTEVSHLDAEKPLSAFDEIDKSYVPILDKLGYLDKLKTMFDEGKSPEEALEMIMADIAKRKLEIEAIKIHQKFDHNPMLGRK